ncbi:MAG: ABC transporter substrate-binding protein [Thermoprotei archaeon]
MLTLSRRPAASTAIGVTVAAVIVALIAVAVLVVTSENSSTKSTSIPKTTTTTSSKTSTTSTPQTALKCPPADQYPRLTFTSEHLGAEANSTLSNTVASQQGPSPRNSSVLVDDSITAAPDGLDPAFGFSVSDTSYFNSVFQQLVEFNGSSVTQVIPVLASKYVIANDYMNYSFSIRPGVRFSNGDQVNAATVWFSYVRELYMGQVVGWANFLGLTVRPTYFETTGYALPWGLGRALACATGNPEAYYNTTVMSAYLNNILSHWNPENSTIQELMSFPYQAYVVSGNMTFNVNLLVHYSYFLTDIASWWGAVVDPAYVDAHGGVQANTVNSYFNNNGGPGTGPYMIKSVGVSLSTLELVKNPYYWNANGKYSDAPNVEPAHIPNVIINYGLSHTDRVEDFGTGAAQLSYVSIPFFGQMYNSYNYKDQYSFQDIFHDYGPSDCFFYFSFNTQIAPTNNTDYRYALVHAINYTAILHSLYSYNGSLYAQEYFGPLSPVFPQFKELNTTNYPYNLNIAAKYLNKSLWQMGYQVTMANGTILGNPSAPPLPVQTAVTVTPISPSLQAEFEVIQSGLNQLGISLALKPVTSTLLGEEMVHANTSPTYTVGLTWCPDWPDPYNQVVVAAFTVFDGMWAWMNVPKTNSILYNISYETNSSLQFNQLRYIYNFTYYYAPYAYVPNPDVYLFVQPYVQGLVYNPIIGYWYNSVYYS